ncbi:transposable element Tcb1 transposase [Trichonephila clavipes]|nr:transposable element Tcb1 transposase [Trichonephila clavipes]
MDWSAYSPDLNPIEHVWDMLGRRIATRQPPPTYLPELRRTLLDEWYNIPQDQIDNLILSMPRRCATETSRNITARVIERGTNGEIYYFVEDSRWLRSPTWSPMTPKYSPNWSPTWSPKMVVLIESPL